MVSSLRWRDHVCSRWSPENFYHIRVWGQRRTVQHQQGALLPEEAQPGGCKLLAHSVAGKSVLDQKRFFWVWMIAKLRNKFLQTKQNKQTKSTTVFHLLLWETRTAGQLEPTVPGGSEVGPVPFCTAPGLFYSSASSLLGPSVCLPAQHFSTDKEAEAQGGAGACPRSHCN